MSYEGNTTMILIDFVVEKLISQKVVCLVYMSIKAFWMGRLLSNIVSKVPFHSFIWVYWWVQTQG
jgi:hypothetical protein